MKLIAFSNLWIALAAGLDVVTTYLLIHQKINFFVVIFVFSSTLFVYNFLRVMKSKNVDVSDKSVQLRWVSKNLKLITFLILIGITGTGISFFFLTTTQKIIALGGGLISILYNFSFFAKNIALRNIPYLKTILVAFTWAIAAVLIPSSENNFVFPYEIFLLRAVFIMILLIPFDIRDLKYDSKKMKTIPQIFGKVGAVLFGILLCIGSIIFAHFYLENHIPIVLTLLMTIIVLLFSIRERKEIFYPIVVDGLIILQMLLVGVFVL